VASCLLGYGVENGFRVWNLRRGVIGVDKLDRGDLIFGPSGTGKTMLAEVVAQSCGVQFIAFSIGDLFQNDAHLGEVIKAPRGLFDRARLLAPCVLFIDELDSLPNRGSVGSQGRDWWLPVVNAFLMDLPGTEPSNCVDIAQAIQLNATNPVSEMAEL
jgi:SpoVK/Ycf46/Vps4 family AAA+-type ATPase